MLMVAPTGKTKLLTSFSTPICSSTRSIVTGKVAALELVEKASNCAGAILPRNHNGDFFTYKAKIKQYTTIINANPAITASA